MNARDLIELLEELDPATEVRVAHQPSWPFEYSLTANLVRSEDGDRLVVWLAEGEQLGYLPGFVSQALGWR